METDISALMSTLDPEQIRVEIGKLQLQPGDVLVVRRSDGEVVSRAEAKRVRQAVLMAFEGTGFRPAILFVDGYELAVIHG